MRCGPSQRQVPDQAYRWQDVGDSRHAAGDRDRWLHGIQPKAGRDLGLLGKRYGDRICFWGGVDVDLLVEGTPDQVRAAVRYAIESAGNGGLVLTSGNTLMLGTRYENYLAMLDAARSQD